SRRAEPALEALERLLEQVPADRGEQRAHADADRQQVEEAAVAGGRVHPAAPRRLTESADLCNGPLHPVEVPQVDAVGHGPEPDERGPRPRSTGPPAILRTEHGREHQQEGEQAEADLAAVPE